MEQEKIYTIPVTWLRIILYFTLGTAFIYGLNIRNDALAETICLLPAWFLLLTVIEKAIN